MLSLHALFLFDFVLFRYISCWFFHLFLVSSASEDPCVYDNPAIAETGSQLNIHHVVQPQFSGVSNN